MLHARVTLLGLVLVLAGCAAQPVASSCVAAPLPALDCGDDCPLRSGPRAEGVTRAAPAPRRVRTTRIHVDVDGVDLDDVCERIGKLVGVNVLVDPNVQEVVTVSLKEIPWREAIDVIAKMTRCKVEVRPGGRLLLTRASAAITFCLKNASVRRQLQLLAFFVGREIVLPATLAGQVTLSTSGTPESLMAEILTAARLPYAVVWGHPIRFKPKLELEPRLFELR